MGDNFINSGMLVEVLGNPAHFIHDRLFNKGAKDL